MKYVQQCNKVWDNDLKIVNCLLFPKDEKNVQKMRKIGKQSTFEEKVGKDQLRIKAVPTPYQGNEIKLHNFLVIGLENVRILQYRIFIISLYSFFEEMALMDKNKRQVMIIGRGDGMGGT